MTESGAERSTLEALWALRQVDARLSEARARRAALDDGAAVRAEAQAARAATDEAAARLRAAEASLRDQELQLDTTEAKRRRAEEELYSGRVRNPKELASLQEDVAALTRAREHCEDRLLLLLEEVDALRREALRTREEAQGAEERLRAHLAYYEAARSQLDGELAALEAQRRAAAAKVDPALLRKYEAIAAQEGGVGMVEVVSGHCGGCHHTVPPHFVSRVRDGHVVTCERCHRILYLPPWPDAAR